MVSGGGLALDGSAWVSLPTGKKQRRRPFLFPVAALAAVFRGKYIAALTRARNRGELHFAGHSAALADPVHWAQLLASLAGTDWVVYCKRPFGGPAQVLQYLSRYTHRVAIANRRLLFVGDGVVRFAYRDYADHHCLKEMTLPAAEFLRRFLLPVVPSGFIAHPPHYGITANCPRGRKLQRCRELFGSAPAATADTDPTTPPTPDTATISADATGKRCPRCGAPLRIIEILPATHSDVLAARAPPDTS